MKIQSYSTSMATTLLECGSDPNTLNLGHLRSSQSPCPGSRLGPLRAPVQIHRWWVLPMRSQKDPDLGFPRVGVPQGDLSVQPNTQTHGGSEWSPGLGANVRRWNRQNSGGFEEWSVKQCHKPPIDGLYRPCMVKLVVVDPTLLSSPSVSAQETLPPATTTKTPPSRAWSKGHPTSTW